MLELNNSKVVFLITLTVLLRKQIGLNRKSNPESSFPVSATLPHREERPGFNPSSD